MEVNQGSLQFFYVCELYEMTFVSILVLGQLIVVAIIFDQDP